ncbi:hypothetical protein FIBSPDRAFT_988084 [Athelia psychrophila]|uniref:C2 domain-containing protein n=1 Tax=Athelia psychrophila TaxID=1759441 RepID=A0A166A7S4_9AGAM|nr:hypothetical protein FIBSPDRAFT_988084 [Fibularhizoctonia sp. CBS 109695]
MSPQSSPVAYTLQIINVNDLPPRRFKILGERRNVLVKATIEDRSVQTESRLCTSSPEWKETFQISSLGAELYLTRSEACETSSVLSLQLFDSAFRSTSLICASVITISDLLQLCRHGKDAELNLCDIKSRLKGCIKIHFSLSSNGSWIADEAQRWALVLSQPPNTAMEATGGYIDDIDGLLAVSVPTVPSDAVSQSIVDVLDKLSHFMRIADEVAKVHPYAKLAWDVLSAAHKIIVAQVAIDQSIADLASTMQGTYSFVDALEAVPSKIPLLEDIIQRIFIQTVECAIFIREYSGHGFAGRLLRETMGASTPAKVAGMAQNLITLRGQFDTGVAVQIATISFRIQTDVTTVLENQTLGLLGSCGVDLGSLSLCLPGTRRDVIDEIHEWALHPSKGDDSNVMWVYGVAGTGKSALAATVATQFSEMGRLGAFLGFDRVSSPEQSQPYPVVKALAHQLAEYDGRLRASIIQIINDRTKAPVLRAPLSEQFDRLIVKPLASIPALAGEGPIVVVLDALYECGRPNDWVSLLKVLVSRTESLPSNLRFIITSRTVNGIQKASTSTVLHPRIKSRELRSSSQSDIHAYFTIQMQQIRLENDDLQEDWPGRPAIVELTARASGLFAWAVNAKTFVDAHCPPERLQCLLLQPLISIPDPNTPLDEIYRAALSSAGDWTDVHFVSDFRAIMGAIFASPIAIPTSDIIHLLDRPLARPAIVTIRRLGSVLTHEPVVRVLHPSFLDFLSRRERCGRDDWYFEHGPVRVDTDPATLCLQIMNTGLKRNVGNMTLPTGLATEVLPEELAYACQSWAYHICPNGTLESAATEMLFVFFRTHFLHWFEAMSLLNKSEEIDPMLQRRGMENNFEDKSLGNLVMDAVSLGRKFAADDTGPATQCLQKMNTGLKRNICAMTVSACPTTKMLPKELAHACQTWVDHICTDVTFGSWGMEKLVAFLRTHLLHWFEAMSLLKTSEEIVPMLQRVATWLGENTFEDKSLKDLVIKAINFARKFAAEIAEHPLYVYYTALPLLPSHSVLYQLFHNSLVDPSILLVTNPDTIDCLALSTNGRRIVTNYYTRVIVRDTVTGEELVTMAGTDGIGYPLSVAFSYDGSRIAYGTGRSTVYIWDSGTGVRVIGPLSHSRSSLDVNVVAWSTDGECLLSGCRTGEVILWNITSPNGNQPITKIHHPGCSEQLNPLSSLVFSSDGSQIASSSRRGDVHVWDSKTGGIVWSVQDPQGSDPLGGVSFLSSDTREFLVVKTKERTQARDASTGELCPLPDSLAGAVGLTRSDFRVNLLIEAIAKPHGSTNITLWAAQGEYFAFKFAGESLCRVVHLPKPFL